MPRAGISLGSNLGDRLENLRRATIHLQMLATPGEPFLTAPIYETEPFDCPVNSPAFLNTVVEIEFAGDAFQLLTMTRAIENDLGRTPHRERNAPRLIDLDLLYFGMETIDTEALKIPHPRLAAREFVLHPLADIRPELILPGQTDCAAVLLTRLPSGVVQVSNF